MYLDVDIAVIVSCNSIKNGLVYILSMCICVSSARNMHHGAQSSAQEACCQVIGFRHMFLAPDCASCEVMHMSCG